MERIDRNDMEELLFAISNAAHAEYHLIEIAMNNYELYVANPTVIASQIERLRATRRSLMSILEIKRPNVGPLWCTLKHMLLLHFHLIELYERNMDTTYLELAYNTWDDIGNLLKDKDTFTNYEHCAICNQDRKSSGDRSNSTKS